MRIELVYGKDLAKVRNFHKVPHSMAGGLRSQPVAGHLDQEMDLAFRRALPSSL